jgi:ATPase family associated with various cellular activities (AAA)
MHGGESRATAAGVAAAAREPLRPELADVTRLSRRIVRLVVAAARAEDQPLQRLLFDHLGPGWASLPVVTGSWASFDHVNVQIGLDAWLAAPGRRHELVGVTGFHHAPFGLGDFGQPGGRNLHTRSLGVGSVAVVTMPAGPAGQTRSCVECGLYLIDDAGTRLAVLLRAQGGGVSLEVAGVGQDHAEHVLDEVRRLAIEHNVYRGQVISFGGEVFGPAGSPLSFLNRARVDRSKVILPPDLLDGIEQQVLGVAQYARRLRGTGQHLKRGVLLHGPPGTGKTHTLRYLLGEMSGVTAVVISGGALQAIREACSIARTLQPAVVVVEDVDLIAEQRAPHRGQHPLLFQLLNEMDGLGEDVDVTFLLTTNRADMLEAALAARPGRVDHAAELPLPDAAARRRLISLYQGGLVLDLADPEMVISRTEGVTASFLKELLRRAALYAAQDEQPGDAQDEQPGDAQDQQPGDAPADRPLRVTDAHMSAALDRLLDTRSQLTRTLLGARPLQDSGPP